jgi:hypothetical protein
MHSLPKPLLHRDLKVQHYEIMVISRTGLIYLYSLSFTIADREHPVPPDIFKRPIGVIFDFVIPLQAL